VKAVSEDGEGPLRIALTEEKAELLADMLIIAAGVRPESGLAREAGLAVNERGYIVVGPDMRTSDPDIYAVGDAVEITDFVSGRKGAVALAGPAAKQGRIAAGSIAGLAETYRGTQASAAVKFFDMTLASTGINEKTAQTLGLRYEKSYTYSPSHAEYYPGAEGMAIKLIFETGSGKLLGAQLAGFGGVDKRCDVLATALRGGMTVSDLAQLELCYAPPFSSVRDPVNIAGFTAENILSGRMRVFHWHDVPSLSRDGSVHLLDVRTPAEYAEGHLEGFINMPLDYIRSRIGELDKAKPVYVACRIGLRGYIAARILAQNGFTVYNLSGGQRLYDSAASPLSGAGADT
jgi:rhodanese-related sulfurtransferase